MVDKLDVMFNLQAELQEMYRQRGGRHLGVVGLNLADDDELREAERLTKENAIAMHAEVSELLDSVNWKPWRTWRRDGVDAENVLVEIVDLFHFLINVAITWGVTPDVLASAFAEKHAENRRRQSAGY